MVLERVEEVPIGQEEVPGVAQILSQINGRNAQEDEVPEVVLRLIEPEVEAERAEVEEP